MILVTGGTGFLGAHLLLQLSQNDQPIRAIYRNKERIAQNTVLQQIPAHKIEWVNADVLDLPALEAAFVGVTHVYHCAAVVGFHPKLHQKMMRINIQGTANMVNLSLDYKVQKFVQVSSIAALGEADAPSALVTEENQWKNGEQNQKYALSKYQSEMEVWRGIEEGLNAVVVNPSIVLGVGNYDETSTQLFGTIYKGLPVTTTGSCGYVDVRDVAKCMVLLMQSDISAQRFILNGENSTFTHLFGSIAKALGKKPPSYTPPKFMSQIGWRVLEVVSWFTKKTPLVTKETVASAYRNTAFSNQKICEALGYTFFPLNETINWVAKDFLAQKQKHTS